MKRARCLRTALVTLLLINAAATPGVYARPPEASSDPHDTRVQSIDARDMPAAQKILVDAGDQEALKQLAASGAVQLADYGAFSLWAVTEMQVAPLRSRPGVTARSDFDSIPLRGGLRIGTRAGGKEPPVPQNLHQAPSSDAELWMVQFAGPIKDEWHMAIKDAGLDIVVYMPGNAYVVWGTAAGSRLQELASKDSFIQWTGPYHPAYRLAPSLQQTAGGADEWVDVTVQFYRTRETAASLERLLNLGGAIRKSPEHILVFTNVSLQLPAGRLAEIAGWPDVFNVEPWHAPRLLDEIQDQILAGNIISSSGVISPSAPGYLAWLAAKGFPTNPGEYPVVDIVDDGIDQGNAANVLEPDFHESGSLANPDRVVYIANCTNDASGNGVAGHGHINAGIAGSYNNLSGSPHVDGAGYRRGLGMSPYGRIAGTKIFDNAGDYEIVHCSNTDQGVVAASYTNGAQLTSNSWGDPTASGAYDSSSQAYDALTRDAHTPTVGNQQMLHIFAAGNDGDLGSNTIGSPGTAKNVLTVGATENVRDQGVVDGCNESNADDADDIASFSSRGPADDLRVKPDIMAPGTHVQGPASKDPSYNGAGVCAAYYPDSQTLYTWSSGTSHSTPAIAGAASLVWNYYERVLNPGQTPSPAMLKALLLNTSRYLNGSGASGALPSNSQGWGDANLGTLTDGTPFRLLDQSIVFSGTGQIYRAAGTVVTTTKPFRVSLVWTDAPGSTTGNAYVNDLNLTVSVGGNTYKGNVFNGAYSASGGLADFRNNAESVFIPAGVSGPFLVTITAGNIAGDGVPGNGDPTDQDFALVVYNGDSTPVVLLSRAGISVDDSASGNGSAEPGESIALGIGLQNNGTLAATGVSGQIAVTGGSATLVNDTSSYADIAPAAIITNTTPYTLDVGEDQVCGEPLSFVFTATHNISQTLVHNFSIPTGVLSARTTYTSTDVPKAIHDNSTVTSALPIATAGPIDDIDVRINIMHTYDADLDISLISPSGTIIDLVSDEGDGGNNFTGTIFDDEAATSIVDGSAPFTGRFQPEQPLSLLDGEPISGTWRLRVTDDMNLDTGTLNSFALDIQPRVYTCNFPGVRFSGSSYSANENSGSATIAATLSAASGQTVTVKYATSDGTALAGSDYLTATGTLTFTPGATSRTFSVPITDDPLDEPSETVLLTLSDPVNAGLGALPSALLTILDDDASSFVYLPIVLK